MLKKAVLAAVVAASVSAVGAGSALTSASTIHQRRPCHVPNVIGDTLQRARQVLTARHCGWRANRRSGRIHAQQPRPGRVIPHGAKVRLLLVPIVAKKPTPTATTPTATTPTAPTATTPSTTTPSTTTPTTPTTTGGACGVDGDDQDGDGDHSAGGVDDGDGVCI